MSVIFVYFINFNIACPCSARLCIAPACVPSFYALWIPSKSKVLIKLRAMGAFCGGVALKCKQHWKFCQRATGLTWIAAKRVYCKQAPVARLQSSPPVAHCWLFRLAKAKQKAKWNLLFMNPAMNATTVDCLHSWESFRFVFHWSTQFHLC